MRPPGTRLHSLSHAARPIEFHADRKALRTMRRAIDHFGRRPKVHELIADDDSFARGPSAACNDAGPMLADILENHGLTDNRLLGRLETGDGIGDRSGFNSPGFHVFHAWESSNGPGVRARSPGS